MLGHNGESIYILWSLFLSSSGCGHCFHDLIVNVLSLQKNIWYSISTEVLKIVVGGGTEEFEQIIVENRLKF